MLYFMGVHCGQKIRQEIDSERVNHKHIGHKEIGPPFKVSILIKRSEEQGIEPAIPALVLIIIH